MTRGEISDRERRDPCEKVADIVRSWISLVEWQWRRIQRARTLDEARAIAAEAVHRTHGVEEGLRILLDLARLEREGLYGDAPDGASLNKGNTDQP